MDGHIHLNLGNIVIIGGVSMLAFIGAAAFAHYLSHKDVPVLSPTARGYNDIWKRVAA